MIAGGAWHLFSARDGQLETVIYIGRHSPVSSRDPVCSPQFGSGPIVPNRGFTVIDAMWESDE